MTLYFVGTGIAGAAGITDEARAVISSSRAVYVERFTSPVPDSEIAEIEKIATDGGASFKVAPRWMVEDGSQILCEALKGDVSLVCFGDPYVATTHIELRTRAIAQKTHTRSIHGASALTSMVGECGLHQYKMGRTATVTAGEAATAYGVIYENVRRGCHTVILLEYDQDSARFLAPSEALGALLETEGDAGKGAATGDTFVMVASRIGRSDQAVVAGKISSIMKEDFGEPPHSILVPGTLHFTEADAIGALARCVDPPRANPGVGSEPHRMIEKYVPMIKEAIAIERGHAGNDEGTNRVLDSAQDYTADAQEFLSSGKDELAVLSIGYADGLVDALRIAASRPYRGVGRANKEGSEVA